MNFFKRFILFSALFIVSTVVVAGPENYTIDPAHSFVLFHISHFDFSKQSGKWYVEGTLVLDKDKPQNDKVNVNIKLDNVVTGIPELDDHLKKEVFFNTAKFPTATFVSTKVEKTGPNSADITGNLTIRGVSKPVVLKAQLNKAGVSPITNKMTAGFSATTQLSRSDFGMSSLPGLGNTVDIEIQIEATKN